MASEQDRPVASFEDFDAIIEGQRRTIAKLEAERDALRLDVQGMIYESDKIKAERNAAEKEWDALKQVLSSSGLAQQNAELIARLEAKTEREILLERCFGPIYVLEIMEERDALKAEATAEHEKVIHWMGVASDWSHKNAKLRELAGELVTYIEDHAPTDDATLDIETDALLARAAALGVEGAK